MMSGDKELTFTIERRKVQVVGGNTITVSLPRQWVDQHNVGREEGKEQEIAMRYMPDSTLLLFPSNSDQKIPERVRDYVFEKDEVSTIRKIKRVIKADFLGGIDIIRIGVEDDLSQNSQQEIQSFVSERLIGFDTIITDYGVEVINMTQAPKFKVDRLLEILKVQSTRMLSDCLGWLIDDTVDKTKLRDDIADLEISLDRRSNQMLRTLQLAVLDFWIAESVELPTAETIYWSIVTKAIENGADLAVAITEIAPNLNDLEDRKAVEEFYELGKEMVDFFSKAITAFVEVDYRIALNVLEDQYLLSATSQQKWPIENVTNLPGGYTLVLRHIEKIGVYARKIAEAAMDREAARLAYINK